jgi:putative tricarboxylic transport membrane protein
MSKKKLLLSMVVVYSLVALALATAPPAMAGEYPDKGIELVIHTAAGGAADVFGRSIALLLNNEGLVKPKITVTNRIGGSATVANNYLASKKGDPYLLMGWTTAPLVAVLRGTSTVKDPMEMTWLCNLTQDPNMLVVRADSQFKTLAELIDYAKKNPEKVTVAIPSLGGSEHVMVNRIEKATGAKFNPTSFSTMNSIVALLGGHVDFAFGNMQETGESLRAKKFRALAAVGEKRTQFFPDVPTMKEQGVNASFTQHRGIWAPPEMPDFALKFWDSAFAKLVETKGFKDYVKSVEMEPTFMGVEAVRKFIAQYSKELSIDLNELDIYGGKKK